MHSHSMAPHFMSPAIALLPSHPSHFHLSHHPSIVCLPPGRCYFTHLPVMSPLVMPSSTCFVTPQSVHQDTFNPYNIILVYHGQPGKSSCNLDDLVAVLNNPSKLKFQHAEKTLSWVGVCYVSH